MSVIPESPPEPLPVLTALNLPWPVDWVDIFGVDRPLILDIGFGYGHSLTYLQRTRPDHNIIGIEVDNISLGKAERALVRNGWTNVRVIEAFAETALQHLFVPDSLDEIHINFPDPWFKSRHAGRRLMKRSTVDAMVSRLRNRGRLFLATDILEYADMSHQLLHDTPGLTNTLPTPWVTTRPEPFTTKYEKRAQQEGRTCRYFVYQRNDQPAPQVPVIQELKMPHIVFQSTLDLDTMMTHARTDEDHTTAATVKFLERYRGDRSVLFDVFVREPTLDQRIAVVLVEREDHPNEYTLKLSALGHPRPTAGIHQAVRIIGDALLALDPEANLIHDKVRR
ncbi:MAG: tRNA (guanosine(46)-N7)-methyltransferase TrmB [Chloroflexota bacterium]